jgi:predicted RNase H-like HicB family nuclease
MTKEFNIIIERDSEGYLVASVPTLRGCHTQARSLDVLIERNNPGGYTDAVQR